MEKEHTEVMIFHPFQDLFAGFDEDIKDWMLKMEENALEKKFYSKFIRDYITYEFLVEKEHSFEVLILLNYSRLYSVWPEAAVADNFNIA